MTHIMRIDEMVNMNKTYNGVTFLKVDLCKNFFTIGDALLTEPGRLAYFEVEYEGNEYQITIEAQGEIDIDDNETGDSYSDPSDYPEELVKEIKDGTIFTNSYSDRFVLNSNTWYEFTICDESGNVLYSFQDETNPNDYKNMDKLCNSIADTLISNLGGEEGEEGEDWW